MEVRIKVNANKIYDISYNGLIKSEEMCKELFKNEHITKAVSNVSENIGNILYDGKSVLYAQYDMLTNEVILHLRND